MKFGKVCRARGKGKKTPLEYTFYFLKYMEN